MGRKARKKKEHRNRGDHHTSAPSKRSNRRKWLIGIFFILIVGGGALWWNGTSGMHESSSVELMLEHASRFSLPATTGGSVRLDDYVGKQEVALFFYMFAG